ncbi:hypothetical protein AgCh_018123 [Apium graveolens]
MKTLFDFVIGSVQIMVQPQPMDPKKDLTELLFHDSLILFIFVCDPTENDSVEGLRPNARGPGLVTFWPDRVKEFCSNNDLQLIVRAHQCVMFVFERFAPGHLITLFLATNYCAEKERPSDGNERIPSPTKEALLRPLSKSFFRRIN